MSILVTGGHGFIGSHVVAHLLQNYSDRIINLDCNTYAARPAFLERLLAQNPAWAKRYVHVNADIRDQAAVSRVMREYLPHAVIHLAAESHVCRSIAGPKVFVDTNVVGTWNLLEEFRLSRGAYIGSPCFRFLFVSTDEVFGELPLDRPEWKFSESSPLAPRSPYAASKAAAEQMVLAYHHTYGLNTVITNCSNNFGPNQHEEKLIPRTLMALLRGDPIVVHGQGDHVRDWLFVEDHVSALMAVLESGKPGERYCIGGENERRNIDVINDVAINLMHVEGRARLMELKHTDDRPTDDTRYAIDTAKIRGLGWKPKGAYHDNLRATIRYYLEQGRLS